LELFSTVTTSLPDAALLPPQFPQAEQLVASDDHRNVTLLPARTSAVELASVSVVAGTVVTDTLAWRTPPFPVHDNVNCESRGTPMVSLPLTVREPLQAPDALHAAAFLADHVRVTGESAGTVDADAVSVTTGAAAMPTATDARPLPPGPLHSRL
jgi:hypothetical protein